MKIRIPIHYRPKIKTFYYAELPFWKISGWISLWKTIKKSKRSFVGYMDIAIEGFLHIFLKSEKEDKSND